MNILIYFDKGCHECSAHAIRNRLIELYGFSRKIRLVNSSYLRTKSWEKKTFALVMGAGACSEWEEHLQREGIQKIHDYVVSGGKYLGICAGAYFAAAYSEFRLVEQPPLTKKRALCFYMGKAVGPLIPTTNHLSLQSALALKVVLPAGKQGYCYYQGGPMFDISESTDATRVLMKYDDPFNLAALISCTVGEGKALLCSPHPEFTWEKCQSQSDYAVLANFLSEQEVFSKEIWETIKCELE